MSAPADDRLVTVPRCDYGLAADLLARALVDDPVYRWMVERPDRRTRWVRTLMQGAVALCAPHIFGLAEGGLAAVAAVAAPGAWPAPLGRRLAAAIAVLRGALTQRPSPAAWVRGARAAATAKTLFPRGDRWYLCALGVDPHRQGSGLGSRLLRALIHTTAAREPRRPIYLETTLQANVRFYERAGFTCVGRATCGRDGPSMWALERAVDVRPLASGTGGTSPT